MKHSDARYPDEIDADREANQTEALAPAAGSRPSWKVANAALNRMRRACERGTGCRLTAEMIQHLSLSTIGDIWSEPDPEDENEQAEQPKG
jgi:hypothetical protein